MPIAVYVESMLRDGTLTAQLYGSIWSVALAPPMPPQTPLLAPLTMSVRHPYPHHPTEHAVHPSAASRPHPALPTQPVTVLLACCAPTCAGQHPGLRGADP